MGGKRHIGCKTCKLEFNEESKHLFPIEKHKLKNGTYSEHYRYSRCKNCSNKRKLNYADSNRKFIKKLKESTPCNDCKKYYPYYIMQFDHLRDKKFHIGSGVSKPIELLLDEINKCDIVCANCHAERTHSRKKVK
jgi:hypothetical protein